MTCVYLKNNDVGAVDAQNLPINTAARCHNPFELTRVIDAVIKG